MHSTPPLRRSPSEYQNVWYGKTIERWIYQKVKKMRVYSFFAPRCYAFTSVKRCPSVRPSVRPSVTFVNSVKTNKHIFNSISQSGSQTILVFLY